MPTQVSAWSLAGMFVAAAAVAVTLRMTASGAGGILVLGFALVALGVLGGRSRQVAGDRPHSS